MYPLVPAAVGRFSFGFKDTSSGLVSGDSTMYLSLQSGAETASTMLWSIGHVLAIRLIDHIPRSAEHNAGIPNRLRA